MQTYLWICLILFLAGFVQGLSGFGAVLFSLPLLSIFLDIKTVIPLVALAAQMMTLIVLVQLWRHLEWKKVYPLIIGAIPGVFVGVYFLKKFDTGAIYWLLGATLIVYALYSLFIQKSVKRIRERWAFLFGFLGGCLGGAFSASGPPAIVYTSLSSWNKDQIKVTLQGYFILSGLFVITGHAVSGLTTITVLKFFTASVPMLVLGTYTGSFFYGMIQETGYRKIILILLVFLGLLMIYRA